MRIWKDLFPRLTIIIKCPVVKLVGLLPGGANNSVDGTLVELLNEHNSRRCTVTKSSDKRILVYNGIASEFYSQLALSNFFDIYKWALYKAGKLIIKL